MNIGENSYTLKQTEAQDFWKKLQEELNNPNPENCTLEETGKHSSSRKNEKSCGEKRKPENLEGNPEKRVTRLNSRI